MSDIDVTKVPGWEGSVGRASGSRWGSAAAAAAVHMTAAADEQPKRDPDRRVVTLEVPLVDELPPRPIADGLVAKGDKVFAWVRGGWWLMGPAGGER